MSMLITIAGLLGINVPRLIGYTVVAIAIVIGGITLKFHYINIGRDQVTNEIAAENRETLSNVNAAKGKVAECRNAGRSWNTSDGVCE